MSYLRKFLLSSAQININKECPICEKICYLLRTANIHTYTDIHTNMCIRLENIKHARSVLCYHTQTQNSTGDIFFTKRCFFFAL